MVEQAPGHSRSLEATDSRLRVYRVHQADVFEALAAAVGTGGPDGLGVRMPWLRLPADARLVSAFHDPDANCFAFVVWSASFHPTTRGHQLAQCCGPGEQGVSDFRVVTR